MERRDKNTNVQENKGRGTSMKEKLLKNYSFF